MNPQESAPPPLRQATSTGCDAAEPPHRAELRQIRDAVAALAAAPHLGSHVFRANAGSSIQSGVANTGAETLLETIDDVCARSGATAAFGAEAVVVYGKWLFPGLQTPSSVDWSTFESDALGSIRKDGRKSTVNTCALHPVEMVQKYGKS